MLQDFRTKLSPALARKLIIYNQIKPIDISDEVYELASQDLVSRDDFDQFGVPFPQTNEVDLLQYLNDFNGRSIILTNSDYNAANVFLTYSRIKNKFPLLIVAEDKTFSSIGCIITGLKEKYPDINYKVMVGDLNNAKLGEDYFTKADVYFCSLRTIFRLKDLFFNNTIKSILLFGGKEHRSTNNTYCSGITEFQHALASMKFVNSFSVTYNIEGIINNNAQPSSLTDLGLCIQHKKRLNEIADQILLGRLHDLIFDQKVKKRAKQSGYDLVEMHLLYLSGISTQLL